MEIQIENIPQELKDHDQWVVWKWEKTKNGKRTKPPYDAKTGKNASHGHPSTWRTFKDTVKAHDRGFDGIGYVFIEEDGLCGVDLDDCRDPVTGEIAPWAVKSIKEFDSYTEVSPSKTGLKIFIKGKLLGGGIKTKHVEVYDRLRYFTVTGEKYGDQTDIKENQDTLDKLVMELRPPEKPKTTPQRNDSTLAGNELIEKIRSARNGDKTLRLLYGNWDGYESQSEADLALCNHLAFWTRKNEAQMDSFFRTSGLMREKWDEKHYSDGRTYGQAIIEKAIANTHETYKGRRESHAKSIGTHHRKNQKNLDEMENVFNAAFEGQKGCATLFRDEYKDQFCYDHAAGCWYDFTGHHWQLDPIGEPVANLDVISKRFSKAAFECSGRIIQLGEEIKNLTDKGAEDTIKAEIAQLKAKENVCNKQAVNLNTLMYRKQVIEFAAQGTGSLGISGDEWDQHPWLLPCKNGVVDLRTGELSDGEPGLYLKTVAPTDFNLSAGCPRFDNFLIEVFDYDEGIISFLQRLFGMALIGESLEHVFPILWGGGRNGKDTLLEGIAHALGPMAGATQSELLLDQGRRGRTVGAPNAEVMALRGRRIAWTSETNEGRRLDAGRVKLLTGGGTLSGRAPFGKREINFSQSHTLFLITNHKPRASSDDYALWKRLHLIPFTMSFVSDPKAEHEREADKHLVSKLKKEASGILAWLVRGCLAWQEQGLKPPEIVEAATRDYQASEDILEAFISECCVLHDNAKTGAQALYDEYNKWSQNNNLKAMTGRTFGDKMTERFSKKKERTGATYSGIGILSQGEEL
jgi:putative DNA primase/helicase